MPSRHDPAEDRAHPLPDTPARHRDGKRIVIISASVGAGHDGAAAEIARRLAASGFRVDRLDFVDLLPAHLGKLLRAGYRRLLGLAPAGYQRIYVTTERASRPGLVMRALLRSAERRTLRALPPDARAIVSTHHAASQVLGALRLRGGLTVPALTYLTDFSVHPLWVAPGIDAHMAVHAVPADQARAQGAMAVVVTGPVVDPAFTPATPAERQVARVRFGLPEHASLALLVAGSWGVGSVREAAAEIRDSGIAVPVVVCGYNLALADRLRKDGIEHTYGWVDDMPDLMRACDILVQNAGGLTSLEAFASGLPVASYRCIPGHGHTNAAALEEAGLAAWIRRPDQLKPVLAELLEGSLGRRQRAEALALYRPGPGPGPVHTIASAVQGQTITARTRTAHRPVRRRMTVLAATVATMLCLGIGAGAVEGHLPAHIDWLTGLTEAHHR
ncbi:MGDG synthase family glycosyltransferase [Actinoallomurus sp. CA-150999]|uniref:MGDG synthase family glycosyltransferase n=1 Tax=Actinoallomurus sp. CA-150999 TaxID=3239887 RepID=UPI003D90BE47